ncbi:MAG: hypothetical protein SGARI_002176, partial [Bacillariaceae sp.]
MLVSFADFGLTCYGQPIVRGYGKKKSKKTKKKKLANWFEGLKVPQLKELCKAVMLPVSGTKAELVDLLLNCYPANDLSSYRVAGLKELLKEQMLIQSGTKYEMVLRLLHDKFGTGQAKRAATETKVDPSTGQEVQVLKKRKTTPSPKMIYTRVSKKMQAVTQKKYQTHFGSKGHSPDVYNLMNDLIRDHCIKEKVVESDPRLAEEMARSVFQAFYDNWSVMERTGYDTDVFRQALDAYGVVLKAVRPLFSATEIEKVVSLLENIEASVSGYCLAKRFDTDASVYYSTGDGKEDTWMTAKDKKDKGYDVARYKGEN